MLIVTDVIQTLRRAGKAMTVPAIAAKMNRTAVSVRKAVKHLRVSGRVEAVDVVVDTDTGRTMTTRGYQLTKKRRRK